MNETKKIRTKNDLIFNLLRADFSELSESETKDILDYLFDTPASLLQQKHLRKRISKVLSENTKAFPTTGDYQDKALNMLIKVSIIDAQNDFYSFVKIIANNVMPNAYRDGRHIQVICEELQGLYESYVKSQEDPEKYKTGRLQVFLPPRSMKSVLCSILFPAWILGRNPKYRILLLGNNTQNAIDNFGRPLKNLIASQEYQAIFPNTQIHPEVKSAQRFNTTAGGGYFCSGGNVAIAGRGGDFIICDDLLSEQTAFSKVERTKINMNYVPGIRSRSQPGAAELIINTRWHLDDLSGFTMGMDGYIRPDGTPSKPKAFRPWKIISVPAILDEAAAILLKRKGDPKSWFNVGDSYWPEYRPLDALEDLKTNYMNTEPYKWNALYMQNPVPEEGNIVKWSDWKVWKRKKPPAISSILVSFDTAWSEKERADYTAFTVWGVFHRTVETNNGKQYIPCLIMLYAEKGKWSFHELCEKCEWLRSESPWKPDYYVIEKKQSGIGLLQELHRRGFPLYEYDPRASKEERLHSAAVLMKAGRVWVPIQFEGDEPTQDLKEWAQEVVEEVCNFPSAPNDDFTDTVSMAIIWMRDNGIIRHEGYDYEDEDEDQEGGPSSYLGGYTPWGALITGR